MKLMNRNQFTFDLQTFARTAEDVKYRGRRRWNGSHGKVWLDGELVFEIESFEATIEAQREDVLIGNSVDSKVTSLKGEGTMKIKNVINRNFRKLAEEWNAGHDPRSVFTGLLDDPDAVDGQKERISIDNVWFNKITPMQFEKGKVVETEIPFGFTPEDLQYIESID